MPACGLTVRVRQHTMFQSCTVKLTPFQLPIQWAPEVEMDLLSDVCIVYMRCKVYMHICIYVYRYICIYVYEVQSEQNPSLPLIIPFLINAVVTAGIFWSQNYTGRCQ